MTAVAKHGKLLERIMTASAFDLIPWKKVSNAEAFKASFKKGSILFSRDQIDELHLPNYTITVLDEKGLAVDSFTDDELSIEIDKQAYRKMHGLYMDVARSISGADKLIDDLIAELEGDIPF